MDIWLAKQGCVDFTQGRATSEPIGAIVQCAEKLIGVQAAPFFQESQACVTKTSAYEPKIIKEII
jgi:hypothetical protein